MRCRSMARGVNDRRDHSKQVSDKAISPVKRSSARAGRLTMSSGGMTFRDSTNGPTIKGRTRHQARRVPPAWPAASGTRVKVPTSLARNPFGSACTSCGSAAGRRRGTVRRSYQGISPDRIRKISRGPRAPWRSSNSVIKSAEHVALSAQAQTRLFRALSCDVPYRLVMA